ncbi:MAG: hypothetical protein ACLQGJ_11395, partial [Candidatus Dormibacteria bacterium]
MPAESRGWPQSDEELVEIQGRLATAEESALSSDPWLWPGEQPILGGCFVAYARGGAGPGRAGDLRTTISGACWHLTARGRPTTSWPRAWAAAVAWRAGNAADQGSRSSVVTACVPSAYVPGLLARREGPILAAALAALDL